MNAPLRLALAALLLALSPSPSPANVIYHLDTGLPPGQGIGAEIELAGPASATSGWTIADPADVVGLHILNVPYTTGFPPRTTLRDIGAGVFSQFLYPFSSSTGAHPDHGFIPAFTFLNDLQATASFNFGSVSGSVDIVHLDSQNGIDHTVWYGAAGTWVLGPATVPEPASWVLAAVACAAGVLARWGGGRSGNKKTPAVGAGVGGLPCANS